LVQCAAQHVEAPTVRMMASLTYIREVRM